MIEIKEILYQWYRGRSARMIAKSLGASRNTIKKLITEATRFCLSRESAQEQINEVAEKMESVRVPSEKRGRKSALTEHHEQIKIWHTLPDMTATQMHRLLKERNILTSETSIRRYLKQHFPIEPDITIVLKTLPGHQAQVDFGYVGMMFDPVSQKERRTHAFIMTLSYSRHRFVRFVFRQDVSTWIDCHIRAFEFFGGVPETVLLDNLKAGIIKPDIYDPTINRSYAELERYYGFIADPAKVRVPEHKGKVERSVPIVRQQLIAGRSYKDIIAANERSITWSREEIGRVITRTTGETPLARFERDEKPMLKALPNTPFEVSVWAKLLVHRDCHLVFKGSFYSIPFAYVGQEVWVRSGTRILQVFMSERLIKTHVLAEKKGTWVTDMSDYPEHKYGFIKKDREFCLEEAKKIGISVHHVLERVLNVSSITAQRKAQAILRLGDSYGVSDLEAACKHALRFENVEYKSIKNILENGTLMTTLVLRRSQPARLSKGTFLRDASEFSAEGAQICI